MTVSVVKKSIWESHADIVVVTASGSIRQFTGKLEVGNGSAFEASRMYEWFPAVAAARIRDATVGILDKKHLYGFACIEQADLRIGIFQTKLDWEKPAIKALIGFSAIQMMVWLSTQQRRIRSIALNFPGQGLIGGLEPEDVKPIIDSIMDKRVTLYRGSVLGE